jgi:plastocyanin
VNILITIKHNLKKHTIMKNKINLLKNNNPRFFTLLLLIIPAVLLTAFSNKKGGNEKVTNQVTIPTAKPALIKGAADTTVIHLTLKDFAFVPDTLRIPAEKPVKIMIKNTGTVTHEFMAGKGRIAASGDGFKQDLFNNVIVHNSGGKVEMSGMNMEKMESSFMIDVKPDEKATISFTLPKSTKGTWKMGCFFKFGQTSKTHYDAGMKGVVIVE